jgi:hypothetical protein
MDNAKGIEFKQRRVQERAEVGNKRVFGVCSRGNGGIFILGINTRRSNESFLGSSNGRSESSAHQTVSQSEELSLTASWMTRSGRSTTTGRSSNEDVRDFVNPLLASLSFGSDTEYVTEMYVIVDPEVERNGSLEMESP